MILTVTFNPAIDKTAEVDELIPGGLNRLRNVMQDAGGKGINVSKTIHALQGKSVATGFLAGSAGEYIRKVLNGLAIDNDFVWVEGMTRTNLKVLDHTFFIIKVIQLIMVSQLYMGRIDLQIDRTPFYQVWQQR